MNTQTTSATPVELAVYYCCRYLSMLFPVIAAVCALKGGLWSVMGFATIFGVMQVLELALMLSPHGHKMKPGEVNLLHTVPVLGLKQDGQMWVFALLNALSIPVILYAFNIHQYSWWEMLGIAMVFGVGAGITTILVGHEFGHRREPIYKIASTFILSLIYDSHFMINHIGHHKYTGMRRDTSTARRGESIYQFWLRAIFGSYVNAFIFEKERLNARGQSSWSLQNRMFLDTAIKIITPLIIISVFNWQTFLFFLLLSLFACMVGECPNYFTHYGIERKMVNGKPVSSMKDLTWDADCRMSGWIFCGAGFHTKHHFKPTVHGDLLTPTEGRNALRYSFQWLLVICLLPPLWTRMIEPYLQAQYKTSVLNDNTASNFSRTA